MKTTAILLSYFLVLASNARSPKSLSPSEEATFTYNQFLDCKSTELGESRIKCIKKVASENLNDRIIQKIAIWLERANLNKALNTCSDKKLALFPHASKNEYKIIRCINFQFAQKNKKAVIYFLDEAGLMKIDGIQFF